MAYPLSVTRIKLFGRHSEVRCPEGYASLISEKDGQEIHLLDASLQLKTPIFLGPYASKKKIKENQKKNCLLLFHFLVMHFHRNYSLWRGRGTHNWTNLIEPEILSLLPRQLYQVIRYYSVIGEINFLSKLC